MHAAASTTPYRCAAASTPRSTVQARVSERLGKGVLYMYMLHVPFSLTDLSANTLSSAGLDSEASHGVSTRTSDPAPVGRVHRAVER